MLKIIKYLSYNKHKSKKITLNVQNLKFQPKIFTCWASRRFWILILEGQTGLRDRDSRRSSDKGTAIPEGQIRQVKQVMEKDRDSFSPTNVFSNKMSYLNK